MPRDESYMDRVLSEVKAHWQKHPGMRLGQLLEYLAFKKACPVFYLDDIRLCRDESTYVLEAKEK
jgi:hypothetical protein